MAEQHESSARLTQFRAAQAPWNDSKGSSRAIAHETRICSSGAHDHPELLIDPRILQSHKITIYGWSIL